MKIPDAQYSIAEQIDQYHASKLEKPRGHLGASQLGHACDRWLWLSFRWAVASKFEGRTLRIFRRGQNEEATIKSDLQAIGVQFKPGMAQDRVDFGCHISGSIDDIALSGVPGAPSKKHVCEYKTHNKKSFEQVEDKGVERAKFDHFVQMQSYMHGTGIDRALYVAVCKDDDRLYTERVEYDKGVAENAIARGKRIALSDRMPEPLSVDPSWYQCKWCAAHEFCHGDRLTKEVNCRTCAHSTATEDSKWICERHAGNEIPVEWQREGCDSHVLHPDMVPWKRKEAQDEWQTIYVIKGKDVVNGEPGDGVFGSKELVANPEACAEADEGMAELRKAFGGRVTG